MVRFGARDTLLVGLGWFAVGNLLCGAATDVHNPGGGKAGGGNRQGDGDRPLPLAALSAVRPSGDRGHRLLWRGGIRDPAHDTAADGAGQRRAVVALDLLGERSGRPVGVSAGAAFPPARPAAQPLPLRIDWVGVTLFATWIVSVTFTFGWYRKWGGWTSNAFAATALLAMVLPFVLVAWVGAGMGVSEHFNRMFRVRGYVLAMSTRMLMLVQLLAVLTLMANYCVGLRDYPREVAGWILAPASFAMAISTISTTWFHRRSLRHWWLLVGVIGCAGCLWWMSSVDNFTSKGQVALMVGCWGLFVGLFPPVFLQDEIEGLDRRDSLYAGALAIVAIAVPIVIIPTMTSTVVSAWSDRALESQRLNLRQNRPEVEGSAARIADYYQQHGVGPAEASQMTSTVLGGFAKVEAVAHGIQSGLRFLSLVVGGIGLAITALLARSASPKPA